MPDYAELLVARRLGRDLTPLQGFIVQLVVIVAVVATFWAFLASGLFWQIAHPIAQWYAELALSGLTSTPSPSPSP